MSHAISLSFEVTLVVWVGCRFDSNVLHDFQSVCFQSDAFYRVVGHESHLVYTEVTQHLRATTIVALIGFKAEVCVGINGVVAFFLKFVSSYLFIKPIPLPSCCM